jgi:hypothetical protein
MAHFKTRKPVEKKTVTPNKSTERQNDMLDNQDNYWPDNAPLKGIKNKEGRDSRIQTPSMFLNKAAESNPTLTRRALISLQRLYGNTFVQRVVDLQRKEEEPSGVGPEVEQTIQSKRGSGQPLDKATRLSMENAFGSDFSGVRIHRDGDADTLNRALSSRAFTTGQDIFFKQGEYNTGNSDGRELLAHELTHVVQQTRGIHNKMNVSLPGDRYEQEADRVAREVVQRERQNTPPTTESEKIRRQIEEEEEEELQAKHLIQKQEEEEEELQPKRLIQKQEEEEEETLQSKKIQGIGSTSPEYLHRSNLGSASRGIRQLAGSELIQRQGPAAAGAAALGAAEWIGLGAAGYVVAQDAVSASAGDISYTFAEMEGVLLPGGGSNVEEYRRTHPRANIRTHTHTVSTWLNHVTGARAMGIKFGITFNYDGHAIGNISCNILDTYDWPAWSGEVRVNFTPLSLARGDVSVIRITLNLNADRTLLGGLVKSRILHLDGARNIRKLGSGAWVRFNE